MGSETFKTAGSYGLTSTSSTG